MTELISTGLVAFLFGAATCYVVLIMSDKLR